LVSGTVTSESWPWRSKPTRSKTQVTDEKSSPRIRES
jgi:hypothetical protein